MKGIKKILITTISIIAIGIFPLNSLDKGLIDVAKDLTDISEKFRIKNLSIAEFESKNKVTQTELDYIREKTIEALSNIGKIDVLDDYSGSNQSYAILKASVYKKEDGFEVMFKIIKTIDMKVIGVVSKSIGESEIGRLVKNDSFFDSSIDFKSLNDLAKDVSIKNGFRYSVSDTGYTDCSKGNEWVENIQKETLDIRAKYWAYKMKQKDFSLKSLTSNPGSEIKDEDLKGRFYDLLKKYYYSDSDVKLDYSEKKYIEDIFKKEKDVISKCSTFAWGRL